MFALQGRLIINQAARPCQKKKKKKQAARLQCSFEDPALHACNIQRTALFMTRRDKKYMLTSAAWHMFTETP